MFDVLLHPSAAKSLSKLDKSISGQIKNKLGELAQFPERGKHLRHTTFWSLRIGDYRAIYEIKKNENRVVILFIGHRSDVYEDFSKIF